MSDWKLGCLNSHDYERGSISSDPTEHSGEGRKTNMLAVIMRPILVVVLDLVEIVLVELSYKAGKVAVLEVEREDGASKRVHVLSIPHQRPFPVSDTGIRWTDLDDERVSGVAPADDLCKSRILEHSATRPKYELASDLCTEKVCCGC